MSYFVYFLVIINTSWLLYLTYILSRKLSRSTPTAVPPLPTGNYFRSHLERYNPFNDVGGDQSFILCLLDKNNTGVIITSLHTRDTTRVYAKAITNGNFEPETLSKEERRALEKTIKS